MIANARAATGLLAATLCLPMMSFGGGFEKTWTEGASFEVRLNQGLGALGLRERSLRRPGRGQLPMPRPKDAFGGLEPCSVLTARFIQRPALQEAVRMLAPCMEAVSQRYGVPVAAESGLLSKPNWRGGVPGIRIVVAGPLPPGSRAMDDLSLTVTGLYGGALLMHPATVSAAAGVFGEASEVRIGEADSGRAIEVRKGADIIVTLPANPTTGYAWKVSVTDKSFGYPVKEEFLPDQAGTDGSGGVQRFTWNTSQPFLSPGGKHSVTLVYARAWETAPPAKTFKFTVNIR